MKKWIPLLCISMFISCLFFAGCKDDEKGEEGGNNNLSKEYFSIDNATFIDDEQPTGSENLIDEVNINANVLTGGSSLLSFTSEEELEKAFIGVQGVKGYYEYDLKNTKAADYEYEILLLMSQNIEVSRFSIILTVQTKSGKVSRQINSTISVIEAGSGDLQISLSWDQLDDVDLHVMDPLGNHIYYGNRFGFDEKVDIDEAYFYFYCYLVQKHLGYNTSALHPNNEDDWDLLEDYLDEIWDTVSEQKVLDEMYDYFDRNYTIKGFLDIDSNAGCDIDAVNSENIYFKDPIIGRYNIYVDLYEKCGSNRAGAKYSIVVTYKGEIVRVSDNQTGQFNASDRGSYDDPDRYVYIGSFTVDGTKASSPVPAKPVSERIERFRKKLVSK